MYSVPEAPTLLQNMLDIYHDDLSITLIIIITNMFNKASGKIQI